MASKRKKLGFFHLRKILFTGIMLCVSVIFFFPFYMMVMMATHATNELYTGIHLLPGTRGLYNAQIVLEAGFLQYYFNSLYVAVLVTAFSVLVSMACGYALAKYSFKGREAFFVFIMITMMIPPQIGLVGFVTEMKQIGWLGNHLPLIVPPAANAFGVYWMRQYARSFIPTAIMESARIDGCGEFQTFFRIIIPMCKPAVITLAILSFVASWNSYLIPLVVINKQELYTMPIAISSIGSLFYAEYAGRIMALAIGTIPILIIFALGSKYFISGLSEGSVKE